ncbi:hypothetical protein ACFLQN_01565 [Candidatus Aenigmatarchaeota archaeon]
MVEISKRIIDVIKDLFVIRNDCFPIQKDGLNEYKVMKGFFSDEIIKSHLKGTLTVGSFQINPNTNTVKWICFDFDGDLDTEFKKTKKLYIHLKENGYNPLLEFSGRRGYHVWLFIKPTDAAIARKFSHEVSKSIIISEIFPKQNKIGVNQYGGQVKIPLGIHRASNKRSFFFDNNFKELSLKKSFNELLSINRKRDVLDIFNLKRFE